MLINSSFLKAWIFIWACLIYGKFNINLYIWGGEIKYMVNSLFISINFSLFLKSDYEWKWKKCNDKGTIYILYIKREKNIAFFSVIIWIRTSLWMLLCSFLFQEVIYFLQRQLALRKDYCTQMKCNYRIQGLDMTSFSGHLRAVLSGLHNGDSSNPYF